MTGAEGAEARFYHADRVLVKFKAGAARPVEGREVQGGVERRARTRAAFGAKLARRFTADSRLELWRLPPGDSVPLILARLRNDPSIEFAEPDFVVRASLTKNPDDPKFVDRSQWNLDSEGDEPFPADIDAPEAWSLRHDAVYADGRTVIVAVVDTGIRRTHEDLAANMWENAAEIPGNGIDDDANGYIDDRWGLNALVFEPEEKQAGDPDDDYGHGTHVAGIVGAVGNNGKGVAGVAWKVRLMAVKSLDQTGTGSVSDAVEAIDYARVSGATLINASWGGAAASQALFEAIERARDAGILVVAAAGNSAVSAETLPSYPAAYALDNVVSVAAVNRWGGFAYLSNFGSAAVDLAAPGEDIQSTYHTNDTEYFAMSGTSMAAPHVTGALALLRVQFPGDSSGRLRNRLLGSVGPAEQMQGRVATGGYLNLDRALRSTGYAPHNDDRAHPMTLVANFPARGNTEGATVERDEPGRGIGANGMSVWYRFSAMEYGRTTVAATGYGAFKPLLDVFLERSNDEPVALGSNVPAGPVATVDLYAQAGRSYLVRVASADGVSGAFSLAMEQRPENDDFAARRPLSGAQGVISARGRGASRENDEPRAEPFEGGASLWFRWTAPVTGKFAFVASLDLSVTLPVINFYRGETLRALERVVSYSSTSHFLGGARWATSSDCEVEVVAGEEYAVQVAADSLGMALSTLRMQWAELPENNCFADARQLQGASGVTHGDTRGAMTRFFNDPPPVVGMGQVDVWFRWTAPRDGRAEFSTVGGAAWDTTLEVYEGNLAQALILLGASDDVDNGRQSLVAFDARAGTDYMVRLNGYLLTAFSAHFETPAGPYALRWGMADAQTTGVTETIAVTNGGSVPVAGTAGGSSLQTTTANQGGIAVSTNGPSPRFAADRVIVKFKSRSVGPDAPGGPAASTRSARVMARTRAGAHLVRGFTADRDLEVWRLPGGISVADALVQLLSDPAVEYAEPDFVVTKADFAPPDDPRYVDHSLWGLDDPPTEEFPGADIDAPEGWAQRTQATLPHGAPVVVAVVDSGVRRTHEDLAANMWENAAEIADNGIDDDGNGYIDDRWGFNAITYTDESTSAGVPADDNGHGTHVAGTIGASANNGKGTIGVAWDVKLMAVKFLDHNGVGLVSDAVEAVDYARKNGAHILNASWGGNEHSRALIEAFQRAHEAKVVVVAAAGNFGGSADAVTFYPSAYAVDNIVSVAATARTGKLALFSAFGALSVDVAAPGETIWSTHHLDDSDYAELSGTSMAAPHVSGALALLKATHPDETPSRLINRLVNSARPSADLEGMVRAGGLLNLDRLLRNTDFTPTNDQRARARGLVFSRPESGNNDGAGLEPGERGLAGNDGASVWYRFVPVRTGTTRVTVAGAAGFKPIAGLYRADPAGGVELIASTRDEASGIEAALEQGRTYWISVDGQDEATGAFSVVVHPVPDADDFAAAQAIAGASGRVSAEGLAASREPGEPWMINQESTEGASVWFKWTAPADGRYTFSSLAEGGAGILWLTAYRGAEITNLTPVDNLRLLLDTWWSTSVVQAAQVVIAVEKGEMYHIQVAVEQGNDVGHLKLLWSPAPTNDDFVDAMILSGASGKISGDSRGAGRNWSDPGQVLAYGGGAADVWFAWTAPRNGLVEFSTEQDTDWDTTLEVFGGDPAAILPLTSNDDAGETRQSRVRFFAQGGQTYHLRLNGFTLGVFARFADTPSGPYQLRWSMLNQPPDIDANDVADLIVTNRASSGSWVTSIRGNQIEEWRSLSGIPAGFEVVETGDFDGDGVIELLLQHPGSGAGRIAVIRERSVSRVTVLAGVGTRVNLAGAADFDLDGTTDLLVENMDSGARGIWLMDALRPSSYVPLETLDLDWRLAAVGDFDADGRSDIVRENRRTGERAFWLMDETSIAADISLGVYPPEVWIASADDWDGDGQSDLVLQNTRTGAASLWLMNVTAVKTTIELAAMDTGSSLVHAPRVAPAFYRQPANRSAPSGSQVSLTAAATGTHALRWQWQLSTDGTAWKDLEEGSLYTGVSTPELRIRGAMVAMNQQRYRVLVTNDAGVAVSRAAMLEVFGSAIAPPPVYQAGQNGNATLTALTTPTPPASFQWFRNGKAVSGATNLVLHFGSVTASDSGIYLGLTTRGDEHELTEAVILGMTTTSKVAGSGIELGENIPHPGGNVYDQVLLTGEAEAITADYAQNQVTRTSFIDLDDDIVQVEFSGPGTLSLVLDAASGPATPRNYNQDVAYMKGHASIVITGADERTNVSIFTVGRATAFDPTGTYNILRPPSGSNQPGRNGSALFAGHEATSYDGIANLAFIAIQSSNGKFGGVRAANVHFFASQGMAGVYAPDVALQGPLFVGDITAFDSATPVLVTGAVDDVRITGGDLDQANGNPVRVAGIRSITFTAGSDSHGNQLSAHLNSATLVENGTDVTAQLVAPP